MATINTHGYKMVGLEEASKSTDNYAKGSGCRDDIYYDQDTGEVWTRFFAGENEWCEYRDDAIIKVGATARHVSAQAIADMVAYELEMMARYA